MPAKRSDLVTNIQHPNKFKVFLVLTFTFAVYGLGKLSGNCLTTKYGLHQHVRSEYRSSIEQPLNIKTALFNRKARLAALRKCCPRQLSFHSLSETQAKNVLTHIIVDRKNKFLYCSVPKVASSNMKRLILTLQNYTDDSNAIMDFDQRGFEFLSDVTPGERDHMIKTFFKFLFVRNPLHRTLSAYRNKIVNGNAQFQLQYSRPIIRKYRNLSASQIKGKVVTFQEFARFLIDKETYVEKMNEHWMPMYEICQPCYINYNFVGSLENLDLDTNALLEKLHAPEKISFPRKQSFYGTSLNKKAISRFYRNITTEQYKSLNRRYVNDFQCFGYKLYDRV